MNDIYSLKSGTKYLQLLETLFPSKGVLWQIWSCCSVTNDLLWTTAGRGEKHNIADEHPFEYKFLYVKKNMQTYKKPTAKV